MACGSCGAENQTEFDAEVNIHFPGPKDLDKTHVLALPQAHYLLRLQLHAVQASRKSVACVARKFQRISFKAS